MAILGNPPQDFEFLKHSQKMYFSVYIVSMEHKLLVNSYPEKHKMSLVFTFTFIYI